MLSFEPEIAAARDAGTIDPAVAARRIAIERREFVPIGRELRALAWIGVMLIASGVGIIIKNHLHEIGPLAIAAAIGAASAGCYAFAVWRRAPSPAASSITDYVVLLGALLFSADVAFIEAQWHLLDGQWQRQFLLVAVVHALVAYAFDSRAVLSLSIAAFAAWMGVEQRAMFQTQLDLAYRAFACAGVLAAWRIVNRKADFKPVFDHFATNFAFWGSLVLTSNDSTRPAGLILALVFATLSLAYGIRRRLQPFVIYAIVYGLIAVDIAAFEWIHDDALIELWLVTSTVSAIVALTVVHFRLRRRKA